MALEKLGKQVEFLTPDKQYTKSTIYHYSREVPYFGGVMVNPIISDTLLYVY